MTIDKQAKHTPTPWAYSNLHDITAGEDSDGDDMVVVTFRNSPRQSVHSVPRHSENVANARFIVKAVNSHEALVAALAAAEGALLLSVSMLKEYGLDEPKYVSDVGKLERIQKALATVRQALATARGEA